MTQRAHNTPGARRPASLRHRPQPRPRRPAPARDRSRREHRRRAPASVPRPARGAPVTFFHCIRCRRRVRIEHHARHAWCPSCGQHMHRGMGRRTRPAKGGKGKR